MTNEYIEKVVKMIQDLPTTHPEIILRKKSLRHGMCQRCGFFSSLYTYDNTNFVCRDCFMELYSKAFNLLKINELELKRKSEENEKRIADRKKRIEKGLAPINLRI